MQDNIDIQDNFTLTVPVLFMIFNRIETTIPVFEQIRTVKPTTLYVAADGPRETREGDAEKVEKVREFIKNNINWKCEVHYLFRERNLGCKNAISQAITWFFEKVEMGIILEDDCLVSNSFFRYCEELLLKYKDDQNVYMISADGRATRNISINESYAFSIYATIWGWASWRRVWSKYDVNMTDWPQNKKKILHQFDYSRTRRFWSVILESVYKKQVDTWDYQFCYLLLKDNAYSIVPKCNLVTNIGYGFESTHTDKIDDKNANIQKSDLDFPLIHPKFVEVNYQIVNYYNKNEFKDMLLIIRLYKFGIAVIKGIFKRIKRIFK